MGDWTPFGKEHFGRTYLAMLAVDIFNVVRKWQHVAKLPLATINAALMTENYSVFKITTIDNSFCPSYASYLAKSVPLSRTVNGKQGM